MSDERRIRRALLSLYDKRGLEPFARELHALGIELLSSGGTAQALAEAGIPVRPVSEETGFPEILEGRVKTLHPRIHGAILADLDRATHRADLEAQGLAPIGLVVVNLYPFAATASRADSTHEAVVEMVDIGGPAMIRAAAKNHAHVGVVVDPADYERVLQELRAQGRLLERTRLELAAKAFAHTAAYDAAIAAYFARRLETAEGAFPPVLVLGWPRARMLRYGENPHQRGALYLDPADDCASAARAQQLQGKELSFNNLLDFDAALDLVVEFDAPACVIVKHGNPCGVALGSTPHAAFERALACDPQSAFGGVIAFNCAVDAPTAEAISAAFYEGVIAPDFEEGARAALARKKNLRLLLARELARYRREGWDLRRIAGGLLAQDWDTPGQGVRAGRVVTKRAPTEQEWQALQLAWTVVRHVRSNAIVYADARGTVGIGAGQMSRVDAARLGISKAQLDLAGTAMASDAFFPFRDGVDVAAEAGVRAVAQPGGSIRDEEVIQAADEHGMAMVFTGRRHFRH